MVDVNASHNHVGQHGSPKGPGHVERIQPGHEAVGKTTDKLNETEEWGRLLQAQDVLVNDDTIFGGTYLC